VFEDTATDCLVVLAPLVFLVRLMSFVFPLILILVVGGRNVGSLKVCGFKSQPDTMQAPETIIS
jgi:hypothetical protein